MGGVGGMRGRGGERRTDAVARLGRSQCHRLTSVDAADKAGRIPSSSEGRALANEGPAGEHSGQAQPCVLQEGGRLGLRVLVEPRDGARHSLAEKPQREAATLPGRHGEPAG